ncbi:hypothetical protein BDW74DRAFT_142941 [Aspergillus multicolor]|uniref:uncharacterized protein n=1 Tax=Aspergillus multicolor TaxID=41759 RepID=UPI003CCCDC54
MQEYELRFHELECLEVRIHALDLLDNASHEVNTRGAKAKLRRRMGLEVEERQDMDPTRTGLRLGRISRTPGLFVAPRVVPAWLESYQHVEREHQAVCQGLEDLHWLWRERQRRRDNAREAQGGFNRRDYAQSWGERQAQDQVPGSLAHTGTSATTDPDTDTGTGSGTKRFDSWGPSGWTSFA